MLYVNPFFSFLGLNKIYIYRENVKFEEEMKTEMLLTFYYRHGWNFQKFTKSQGFSHFSPDFCCLSRFSKIF